MRLIFFYVLLVGILPINESRGQAPTISGPPGTYISSNVLTTQGPINLTGTWSGPAGEYKINMPAGVTVTKTDNSITFTWGQPNPNPTPTPPAPSTKGPYFIAFITDQASRQAPLTPAQVAMSTSQTIGPALKAINPANQWVSPLDVSTPTLSGWLQPIRAAGTPCILIIGTNTAGEGFKVEIIPQPVDETSVVTEVKRLASGGPPQ